MKLDWWPCKTTGHLSYATSCFEHHFVAIGEFKLDYSSETPNLGQIRQFLEPCDLEIWQMTFKNNRAPLICYFKLCAAFRSHWWIRNWSYSPETSNLGQIWRFLASCYLEIWRMTFKNNRAPLLCYFKLCASFRSRWWIQTGVTVRKWLIWVKIDFLVVWPWNLTDDLEEVWGTSLKPHQTLCIILSPYVNSNWSYSPETVLTFVTLTFDLDLLHGYPFCHW